MHIVLGYLNASVRMKATREMSPSMAGMKLSGTALA